LEWTARARGMRRRTFICKIYDWKLARNKTQIDWLQTASVLGNICRGMKCLTVKCLNYKYWLNFVIKKVWKYQSNHNILLHQIQFYGDMFRHFWVIFRPSKEQIQGNKSLCAFWDPKHAFGIPKYSINFDYLGSVPLRAWRWLKRVHFGIPNTSLGSQNAL